MVEKVDQVALWCARMMQDHATLPAKMSGGDKPIGHANLEMWDSRTVLSNPRYKSAGDNWKASGEIEN
jgi:hypothetical protein